jgi:hypothetical protein
MSDLGRYVIVFALIGGAVEGAWFLRALNGTVLTMGTERPPPISARSASTGWRQYHFWHSGFSGGK